MSDSEVYQDDHVPEGARPNRWQSLHVVCRYEHHKPVYSLQRHRDVWHVGASAKNALHCKVMISADPSLPGVGFAFIVGLSR